MFAALGRFSYRWRWWVIAVWSFAFLLGIASLPFLSGVLKGGGFSDPGSPSEHAATLIEQRLGTGFTTWKWSSPPEVSGDQHCLPGDAANRARPG